MNNTKVKLMESDLKQIELLTKNQHKAFEYWNKENSEILILNGAAGVGKTFLGVHLALKEIVSDSPIKNIICIKSPEETKKVGFLPGALDEKVEVFQDSFVDNLNKLIESKSKFGGDPWAFLKEKGTVSFKPSSYLRGVTWDDSVVILDEMQNCTFHELDTIITRLGRNSRLILCGDYYQSDLTKEKDKNGIREFLHIVKHMNRSDIVEFTWEDCVRCDIVRDYLMTKEMVDRGQL